MSVTAVVPEEAVGDVLNDLSAHRRARIRDVAPAGLGGGSGSSSGSSGSTAGAGAGASSNSGRKMLVQAEVPLREMVGYSTHLRSRTGGEGSFSMEFARFAHVGPTLQRAIEADPSRA